MVKTPGWQQPECFLAFHTWYTVIIINKQQINKLHISLFNCLPQWRRKLSQAIPHTHLEFLGTISSPNLTCVFCAHASGNSTGCIFYHLNSNLPKKQACFLQKNCTSHHSSKRIFKWLLFVCHAHFA